MKRGTLAGLCGGTLLLGAAMSLCADGRDNPYQEIVLRNAFNLKPPPPPPDSSATNPPPAPVKIVLTGISTLSGAPKVLLEITENAPGKKPEFPPPLVPGDIQGRVEIVAIDADKGEVKVKIDGNEKLLTFEKDGPKPSGAAAVPAVPGGIPRPPGIMPPPGIPAPAPAAAAAPTGDYGVLVGGASPSTVPAPAATPTLPSATASSYNPANTGGSVGVGGATAYGAAGTPTIPARPLRTSVDVGGVVIGGAGGMATSGQSAAGQAPPVPTMTREQAIAHINEQKRMIKEAEDLGLIPRGKMAPLPNTPGWPPQGGSSVPSPNTPPASLPPGLTGPPRPR